MLTLKIVTLDNLNNTTTYLFSGEIISHEEYVETDHMIDYDQHDMCVGTLDKTSSTQPFVVSCARIFKDKENFIDIVILPKADCFVMENGKTVDSFKVYFK
jgi:hypothetical protein